eukprot:TCONS_00073335-protein
MKRRNLEPSEEHYENLQLSEQSEVCKWIKSIPFWEEDEIEAMVVHVVCEKHWPVGFFEKKGDREKMRPVHPPSVKKCSIPTPPTKERPTKKSSFETKTHKEDQLDKFKLMDAVNCKSFL